MPPTYAVCPICGSFPARMYLPDSKRWICGVCAQRLAVARDLAKRIAIVKRMAVTEV